MKHQDSLTRMYPFHTLGIGDSFVVTERFQHARVAASEYGRKHGMVFTCRMQEDHTMRVYRVTMDQASVDVRGRIGKRRIQPNRAVIDPTREQFMEWISTFTVGQRYSMPRSYAHLFPAMQAWCEVQSLRSGVSIVTYLAPDGTLSIHRMS